MKIEQEKITIRQVVDGYTNSDEEGVLGYGGRLNIRPKYQREFVYKDDQRNAVIQTIRKGFPLNVMYWAKNADGTFELMDGQQRTISFCEYVKGKFSLNYQYFHTLTAAEQEQILDYPLFIYICEGTDKEKLDWFKVINIAGEKLTDQELLNAVYTGEWLTDAKRHFSKTNCPAYNLAKDYVNGQLIRQAYLETAIAWISQKNIQQYMADKQHAPNANELWLYFQAVIAWVKAVFPHYRKEMKGLPWGLFYNRFRHNNYNSVELEQKIVQLMQDDDVTKKSGVYEYLLTGEEKHLSIRAFKPGEKRSAYERQQGICAFCKKEFAIEEMEADHITPWHLGGKTTVENCQMLCKACNRTKSGI